MPEPPIFTKSYDLLLALFPQTLKFPRAVRPSLATPIQEAGVRLLLAIRDARFAREKRGPLARADASLESIRLLLRLAKDLKVVSPKSYLDTAQRVDELGRMLGGWSRSNQGAG
jgi:hypothetical protein